MQMQSMWKGAGYRRDLNRARSRPSLKTIGREPEIMAVPSAVRPAEFEQFMQKPVLYSDGALFAFGIYISSGAPIALPLLEAIEVAALTFVMRIVTVGIRVPIFVKIEDSAVRQGDVVYTRNVDIPRISLALLKLPVVILLVLVEIARQFCECACCPRRSVKAAGMCHRCATQFESRALCHHRNLLP